MRLVFPAGPLPYADHAASGKTALARVLFNEMFTRGLVKHYFEIVAGTVETKAQMDAFIRQIPEAAFVFIDEIHGLSAASRDALLPALQDGVYSFDGKVSMSRLPVGISWLGATTDIGKVHSALQRRMTPIVLDAMSVEDRTKLAMQLNFAIEQAAAKEIAVRSTTPWEVKDELFVVAKDVATVSKASTITLDHVLEACKIIGVDKYGLRPRDRQVLTALFNAKRIIAGQLRYAMSARALTAACGIDAPTYFDSIEPKLLKMNYIRIATALGRELTERALDDYFGFVGKAGEGNSTA